MPHLRLDIETLRQYDERALGVLYLAIENLRRKPLARQEVLRIYKEGITVVFSGHGLSFAPELNYALFYKKVRTRFPLVLALACYAVPGESHAEVIERGPLDKLIVAGSVSSRTFTGVSTTWMKGIQPDSGRHSLGLYMNDLLLDYYSIKREPGWSDQNNKVRSYA